MTFKVFSKALVEQDKDDYKTPYNDSKKLKQQQQSQYFMLLF